MHNDVHAYAVVWTYLIFVERCLYILCIYPYTTTCYGIRKASRLAASSPVSTENTSSNAVFACSSHLILKLPAVEMRCLVQHLVALLKVTSFTGWLNVWTTETDMLGEDVINQKTPAAKTSGLVNPPEIGGISSKLGHVEFFAEMMLPKTSTETLIGWFTCELLCLAVLANWSILIEL